MKNTKINFWRQNSNAKSDFQRFGKNLLLLTTCYWNFLKTVESTDIHTCDTELLQVGTLSANWNHFREPSTNFLGGGGAL